MKLKVCGMKYPKNMLEVAQLQPNYLGFIFYKKSSRFFDGEIPKRLFDINKVGVFVDEEISFVMSMIKKHNLNSIQLHGNESPNYCAELKFEFHLERERWKETIWKPYKGRQGVNELPEKEIIKVFSIKDNFDFSVVKPYEDLCDYFLFDTKGKLPGGNGYTFNWNVLKEYPTTKPFFLSGGIGIDEIEKLKAFKKTEASKYCYAIDVNSQFEIEAGLKDIEKLNEFIKEFKPNVTSSDF